MPDWSIKIIGEEHFDFGKHSSNMQFSPFRQQVLVDDLISWNNQTEAQHQPWPLDAGGKPINLGSMVNPWGVNPVPGGASSNPAYNVASSPTGIVKYGCALHLNEDKTAREVGELEVLTQAPTL
jgi:plastocyanin